MVFNCSTLTYVVMGLILDIFFDVEIKKSKFDLGPKPKHNLEKLVKLIKQKAISRRGKGLALLKAHFNAMSCINVCSI